MRWQWRRHERGSTLWRVIAALCCAIGTAGHAQGQTLNLGGHGPFASDAGHAVLSLEAELRAIAAAPGEDVAIAALAGFAADLARAGKNAGEQGSWCVVQALTIRNRLSDVRARLAVTEGASAVARGAIARDLKVEDESVLRDERRVRVLLRDALAPLMPEPREDDGGPGWWRDEREPRALPESLAVLVAGHKGGEPLVETMTRLDERIVSARRWWAYRSPADTVRRAVARAAPLALEPESWLSRGARESATEEFSRAVSVIADAAERRDAVARLRRLADLGRLVTLCGGVDDAKRTLRTAVSDFVAAVPDGLDDDYAKRLSAALRAAELMREGEPLSDEAKVVRQLRVAVRALAAPARETAGAIRDAVPRLLKSTDAMNDPAVLSAINVHRENVEDLRRVLQASDAMRDPTKPVEVRPDLARIADRLLGFARDATARNASPEARQQLRELARQVTVATEMPGERELRAAVSDEAPAHEIAEQVGRVRAWVGERGKDLVARIDQQRALWIKGWADQRAGVAPVDAARRIDALAALCGLIEDLAASGMQPPSGGELKGAVFPGPAAIEHWPGWEVDVRVLRQWGASAATSVDDAISACVDVDVVVGSGLPGPLERARREWSLIALAGRLNRQAEVLSKRARAGEDAAVRGVLELASGMPDDLDVWLAGQRMQLAVICRYAMEWDAVMEGENEDAARARVLRDAVAARAMDMRGLVGEGVR